MDDLFHEFGWAYFFLQIANKKGERNLDDLSVYDPGVGLESQYVWNELERSTVPVYNHAMTDQAWQHDGFYPANSSFDSMGITR